MQEVPSSNLGSPTKFVSDLRTVVRLKRTILESKWSPHAGLRPAVRAYALTVAELGPRVLRLSSMKHLPLIIAVIALVVALFAWDEAHTALKRIEDFSLRPHPAVNP